MKTTTVDPDSDSPAPRAARAPTVRRARAATPRREADRNRNAAAEERSRLLEAVLAAAPNGILVADLDGRILMANPAVTALTGYTAEELIGQTPRVFKSGRQSAGLYQALWSTIRKGQTWRGEIVNRHKNGNLYTQEICINPIRDAKGALTSFLCVMRDVTARKRTECDLAHERDLLRILLDNIPDSIYFKDAQCRFTRVNQAQMRMLGVDRPESAYGRTDSDFFDTAVAGESDRDERKIIASGKALISKIERITRPGLSRWVTATKVPIRDASGAIKGIVGVSRDITAWKEATEAVQRSEQSLRLLFSAIPHAVWVYDVATGEFLAYNQTALECYGYSAEEFGSLRISAVHPPEEAARLAALLDAFDPAHPPQGVWKHRTKDGHILAVEIGAHALEFQGRKSVLSVVQDVTERKRRELELQHSQRLEAVGQLASGIAHEINTPVQYVGDNLRFLLDAFRNRQSVFEAYQRLRRAMDAGEVTPALLAELDQTLASADLDYVNEEIPRALAQSLDGVERVATIVRAMKEFAHPGHKEKTAADLNKALAGALIVARNELKYVAEVETDFGELPPVVCHLADINQVFLNLLINAADAIREVTKGSAQKGHVTVRTRQSGDRAVISISDTGCGIPSAIQAKVFDPFFTTKQVGRGTGQGLAIARAIVDKHGGSITFEPNLPQGTTFIVSLPIEQTPAASPDEAIFTTPIPETADETHSLRG